MEVPVDPVGMEPGAQICAGGGGGSARALLINENRKGVKNVLFGGSDYHGIELIGNLDSRAIEVISSRSTL